MFLHGPLNVLIVAFLLHTFMRVVLCVCENSSWPLNNLSILTHFGGMVQTSVYIHGKRT